MQLIASTEDQYAAALRADGTRVVQKQGVWWRQVRPCFFRLMLPWSPLDPSIASPTFGSRLGGCQFAVGKPEEANSSLGFLLFTDARHYDRRKLRRSRRWEINNAEKRFTIGHFDSPEHFTRSAHHVYTEFYQRTGYGFRPERVDPGGFQRWANQIFADQGANLFGAFDGAELAAVGILRVIDRMLIYTSFFASHAGLSHHVSSFMLHSIRQAAAECGSIDEIMIGTPKMDESARSVDQFYLSSGCDVRWQPAILRLNPLARLTMRMFVPGVLRQIVGAK